MNTHQAKQEVVKWLRAGGVPNETVPFTYDYFTSVADREPGLACAGAAISHLLGSELTAIELGKRHFGNSFAFLFVELLVKGENVHHDPLIVADHVEKLEIVHD